MGRKSDLLNQFRKEVKAGTFRGTFNEFTGGTFSERGGATAARLESKAIAEASVELDAQIRAAGGNPSNFTLVEKRSLNLNAMAANFARQQATVTTGQSAQDVADGAGITMDELVLQNPSTFGMTSPNSITNTSVFAGQQLNVSSLADRVAAANRQLVGGRGRSAPTAVDFAQRAVDQAAASRIGRGTVVPTSRSVTGGRGTRVPTSQDFAQRGAAQRRATLTPTPNIPTPVNFGGLARTSPLTAQEAQRSVNATLKAATKSFTNKNGRLSQAQIDSIYDNVESSTSGTMEEILSRNAGNPDFQMDAMIDAFASPSFIATIDALGTSDPPTYIDQKAFNALKQMYPDAASALERDYELQELRVGQGARAYWYVGSQDPADTTAGSGATGGGSFSGGDGSILGGGGGGGSSRAPRGTGSTSSGFTPTGRSILWRI